jgi:hypothetical protein
VRDIGRNVEEIARLHHWVPHMADRRISLILSDCPGTGRGTVVLRQGYEDRTRYRGSGHRADREVAG